MTPEDISLAITLFIGRGFSNHPSAFPDRVVERFGTNLGDRLISAVESLLSEYWEAGFPDDSTLDEATDRASARFAELHPEISEEAVMAFDWNFSFNNR